MNSLAFCTSLAVLLQLAVAGYPPCQQKSKDGNFLVSIKKYVFSTRGGSYFHQCTGSVISPEWVLTAANCFNHVYAGERDDPNKWRVSANEMNFLKPTGKEQTREVKRFVRYPGFHGKPSITDVALVQLKTPLDFSTGEITPVCLPEEQVSTNAKNCKVAGWGLDMLGKYIPTPQTLASPVADEATCRKFHGSESPRGFCFGGETGGFCREDINNFVTPWGSPMFCSMSDDGPIVQVGIVNWGASDYPCDTPDVPPLFTKIETLRNWIYRKTLV